MAPGLDTEHGDRVSVSKKCCSLIVMASGLAFTAAACSAEKVPIAEDLSTRLVTADLFPGGWTMNLGPDDAPGDPSGILTEEQRALLPSIELCEDATDDARTAVDALEPIVFRQLDLAVDNPIDVPFDREGHLVFLQEFLYADASDRMRDTFDLVKSGMLSCLGELPAGEEGPGFAEEAPVPEVGDDRVGVVTSIEEAGGWAEWRINQTLVVDGTVMMMFVIVDIRSGNDIDPYFTDADIAEMIRVVADRL